MFRIIALITILSAAIFAAPTIKDVKELIPKIVEDHLDSLTAEERKVFDEFTGIQGVEHELEVLEAVKEKSSSLYEKAMNLKAEIERKTAALGPDAQKFTKNYFEFALTQFRHFLKKEQKSIEDINKGLSGLVIEFNALSEEAKAEVKKEFNSIVKLFEN